MNILINTPDISKSGGVANHYRGLQTHWRSNVQYQHIGGRQGIPGWFLLPFDLLVFFFRLFFGRYDAIILNPSLGATALKRDALFLRVASLFKVKKIVFFHGWNEKIAASISKNPGWFIKNYGKVDSFFVLASSFKNNLVSWGIKQPIFISTTKIDDRLIEGFDIKNKKFNNTLLYLARVEEYKGIFITLEAFKHLKGQFPDLKLVVAGDGTSLSKAREYVLQHNLEKVEFLGHISGNELVQTYSNSDIYILPSYSEGMPTSVLEAMAFGLPIVSRPVGGLVDFFAESQMGYLIDSLDGKDFAHKINELLSDKTQLKAIGAYNYQYACKNFMASQVAKKLEAILEDIVK